MRHYWVAHTLGIISQVCPAASLPQCPWRKDTLRFFNPRQKLSCPGFHLGLRGQGLDQPGSTIPRCSKSSEKLRSKLSVYCTKHFVIQSLCLEPWRGLQRNVSSLCLFLRKLPPDLPKSQRAAGCHWCLHTWNIWTSLVTFCTPISWGENRRFGRGEQLACDLLAALTESLQGTAAGTRVGLWAGA